MYASQHEMLSGGNPPVISLAEFSCCRPDAAWVLLLICCKPEVLWYQKAAHGCCCWHCSCCWLLPRMTRSGLATCSCSPVHWMQRGCVCILQALQARTFYSSGVSLMHMSVPNSVCKYYTANSVTLLRKHTSHLMSDVACIDA